jgi:hypothetical protein
MKFLFKFPSRGRPSSFKKTLISHLNHLSNNHEYYFVFTFDSDDSLMNNQDIINFLDELKINYDVYYGKSKNKIEAINANMGNRDFDILVLIVDDMIPVIKNYDEIIFDILQKSENGLDSTIHFNTSTWSDLLDIWCIMGKRYYDRFNYIYYPEYKTINADNEYTEVSKLLNRRIFSEIGPFFHNFQSQIGDETEVRNWFFNTHDAEVYSRRKNINFGL